MEKILSNPPGHTVYKKVCRENVEMSMEEAIVKLKYGNFDKENSIVDMCQTINFNTVKATQMKGNKRVKIVDPSDIALETKCENLKIEVMKTYERYDTENPNVDFSNLNEQEKMGLKDSLEKVESLECVISHTDKSKKFCVDAPDNYIKDMEPHTQNKKKLTPIL